MTRRALLSTHDKKGLTFLATALVEIGFELVASGGTAHALRQAELPVTPVADITGFPALLGGRVKTLHPGIHAGILARDTPDDRRELDEHDLSLFEFVVCNLYPFEEFAGRAEIDEGRLVEQIDIGGVTLLRAAAKNFARVAVVCDPDDYETVVEELARGDLGLEKRRELALRAFRRTADYDAAIFDALSNSDVRTSTIRTPPRLHLTASRSAELRYGENPHQRAARYLFDGHEEPFELLAGQRAPSYNNLLDLDAAWSAVLDFDEPTVAVVKHTNPCGLAVADSPVEALRAARAGDPVSAFGSIIASNRKISKTFVEELDDLFVEVLVAPDFDEDALAWLGEHKEKTRVIATHATRESRSIRSIAGGLLVQTTEATPRDPASWTVVTERAPSDEELASLAFAWRVVGHVSSNAIVFVRGLATVGVGAGQMNRLEAVHLAVRTSGDRARGAVCASDAFFPFPDGLEKAARAGVTAFVQPGGSIRDPEVTAAADRLGVAMVHTGARCFRH